MFLGTEKAGKCAEQHFTLTPEETDFTQKIKGLPNGKFLLFSKSNGSRQHFDTRELEKTANLMPLKLL